MFTPISMIFFLICINTMISFEIIYAWGFERMRVAAPTWSWPNYYYYYLACCPSREQKWVSALFVCAS